MMPRRVTVELTLLEAENLSCVAGQGWGDGDHADYLGDGVDAAACKRAMTKLDQAIAAVQRVKPAQGTMRVECYVCGADMGKKPGPDGAVSSGLCSARCEVAQWQGEVDRNHDLDFPKCERCDIRLTPESAAWTDTGGLVCTDCHGGDE
jgi:hypothetical protein